MNHRRRRIRSPCFRYTTGQSGRSESNRLSRVPKTRGAPFPFIPLLFLSSSYGSRTHLSALKGPDPQTDRRTSHTSAHTLGAVGREALESSSAAFQATAKPSQLPTHRLIHALRRARRDQQKRPGVVTPGLGLPFEPNSRPSVTSAMGARGYSLRDRQAALTWRFAARNNRRLCVLASISAVRKTWKGLLQLNASVFTTRQLVAGASPNWTPPLSARFTGMIRIRPKNSRLFDAEGTRNRRWSCRRPPQGPLRRSDVAVLAERLRPGLGRGS